VDLAALFLALLASVAIIALGARFLLTPRQAMLGYGVAPDSLRALTEIKGVRDITSGVIMFVVWAAAGRTALGWALIAVTITPVADALIVCTNGGKLSTALGIHGVTAALLLAAGLILALGS
jgi:thiamine transporter ThiT